MIIIHGTYARSGTWWRMDSEGSTGFADRLDRALSMRGQARTLWAPAIQEGFEYEEFSWSGKNAHRDRLLGARKLANTLDRVASALGCSRDDPLEIDFVAHSHGGNVVLEALGILPSNVRPRQVVMLGTPLIRHSPAFRIARLAVGFFLTVVIGAMILVPLAQLLGFFDDSESPSFGATIAWTIFLISAYGWAFWLISEGFDLLIRALFGSMRSLLGGSKGQAYGPPPGALKRILRGNRIVLLTSQLDEAELALQLGSAPHRLYVEAAREKLRGIRAWVERMFVRPFVQGILLKAVELILERYVLGFNWIAVIFRDHEVVDAAGSSAYPPAVVDRVDVTSNLLPTLQHRAEATAPEIALSPINIGQGTDPERRVRSLRKTLHAVSRGLVEQVRLRHSLYYESEAVIEMVADTLVPPPHGSPLPTIAGPGSAL